MNKNSTFLLAILYFCSLTLAAQAPALPTKGDLSQTLLTGRSFTNSSQEDIVVEEQIIADEFTLEVLAKVNVANGRGLDIESRNSKLKGFRLSLDASSLKWTSSLPASRTLSSSNAGEDQLIRIVVKNNMAHIYQNGAYIESLPLSTIKNIVDGEETDSFGGNSEGAASLTANWAGTATDNTGKPSDYGWAITDNASAIFNTANSGSGVRYIDVNETRNRHILNGETYFGRIMFIRWDAEAIKNAAYSYPVTLEANTTYDFSMLHAYWSNATGGKSIHVGIGKTPEAAGRFASQVFPTNGTATLKRDSFVFTSQEAGTYYLTFTGDWALFSVSDLKLNKLNTSPRFIFGKNYPDGAVNMEISSATYEEGAYAPDAIVEGPRQNVTVTARIAYYPTTFNTNFIVPGQTELHFTAEGTPFVNSSVELGSDDAWLYFDNVRPATVISDWLDKVTINGAPAVNNTNVRIAIYKNGTVVIPNGNLTSAEALEVYKQPNLAGDSRKLAIETYHNNLGEFNNTIKSFKLRKGYMATLASNADGTGFSRVFIADEDDLIVNTMPEGLDGTVSFIRVFRWDWVSKKGKAGWSPNKINATWYYDWNIAGGSASNYDYVAIRQHGGWPSWGSINGKQNVNHLLGFNEPDRPDQANITVDQAIAQWPEMMKSGMRIGSPSPSDPYNGWLPQFLEKAEELNYRVDFAAIHCYWGGMSPRQWYDRLLQVYNMVGKRPLWITEWNNGANWTTESWPADQDAQFQKQLNDLKGILLVLDTAHFVERYAIYDWVEDKRALVLGDTLTPAGKYYAANKSDFAFSRKAEYIHTWEMMVPSLSSTINPDDNSKVNLSWKDINGGVSGKYVLERKIDGVDANFIAIHEVSHYEAGSNINYVDDLYDNASYRVKAFNAAGDQFKISAVHKVLVANILEGKRLYISFDERTGTIAEDVWGGYHGSLAAAAVRTEGKVGQAVKLNGTAGAYVSVPEGVVSGLNDFTISTWVKMDALSNWMRIFDFGTGTSKYLFLTPQVNVTNGQSTVRYAIKNGGAEQVISYAYTFPLNTWVHFAVTQSGNTASLYINGDLVGSNTAVTIKPADLGVTTQNYIGKSQFDDPILNGNVDEFRIYNHALSEDQVQELIDEGPINSRVPQTITFDVIETKEIGDPDFDAGASASSELAVSYTSSNPSVAVVENGLIRIVGAGTTTITASQTGNERYLPADEVSQELVVNKKEQSITFIGSTSRSLGEADFEAAEASSALPVTYTSSNEDVAIIVDGKVRMVGLGTTSITATQAGNEEYLPAAAVSQTIEVKPPLAVEKNMEGVSLKVYPNPGIDALFIEGLDAKTYEYTIFNLLGEKIASGTIQYRKIALPAKLADGSYILQVSEGKNIMIQSKILIKK